MLTAVDGAEGEKAHGGILGREKKEKYLHSQNERGQGLLLWGGGGTAESPSDIGGGGGGAVSCYRGRAKEIATESEGKKKKNVSSFHSRRGGKRRKRGG